VCVCERERERERGREGERDEVVAAGMLALARTSIVHTLTLSTLFES
jgi:hypothetical protein